MTTRRFENKFGKLTITDTKILWQVRHPLTKELQTARDYEIRRESQVRKAIADAVADGMVEVQS